MSEKSNHIKIVFLADTHLGFDYPIRPRLVRRRRGDDFFNNYHTILDHAKTHADLLIHGGDMFFKSRVHDKIVDMAYEPLLDVADAGVPVFIVPGNHERSELPTSLLVSHKNIFVFDTPKTFSRTINGLDIALSGFPFQRGNVRSNVVDVLAKTDHQKIRADIKLLCMHQAIEGATVGPANFTFRYSKDTIRLADIPYDFDAVLSGHIHRHQILSKQTSDKKIPVIYPGSIERTAFAEKDEDKGFLEILCGTSGIVKIDFIKLPARPMIDLNIDQADSFESLKNMLLSTVSDFDPNAVVRIKLDGTVPETIKQRINTAFLRTIFPETMNVQLTGDFFAARLVKSPGSQHHKQALVTRIRKEAPNRAGVYLFKDEKRNVIYVGKSINLKQRMVSYFYSKTNQLENRIRQMVFSIRDFSVIETGTELLALLLEDALIKKYLPVYNVKQQEYEEYRYLLLTNDAFPTLKMIAHNEAQNGGGEIFGPFKDQYFVRNVLDLIYRHLNLRQCQEKTPVQKSINFELGLCFGPCRGKIDEQDYSAITQRVRDFLTGDEKHLVEKLAQAMTEAAASLEFEKAAGIKRRIEFCRNFCKRQRFINRFRISDLMLSKNGSIDERYVFSQGRLESAHIGDQQIKHDWINQDAFAVMDARYVLDRANIIYSWLNRSNGFSFSRTWVSKQQ